MQLQLVLCRYLLQTGSFYLVWCQIFFKNYNNLERIDQRYYFTHLFLNLSAIKTCKLLTLVRPSVRFGHLKKTTHFVLKNNQQKTIPNVIQGVWHISSSSPKVWLHKQVFWDKAILYMHFSIECTTFGCVF